MADVRPSIIEDGKGIFVEKEDVEGLGRRNVV